MTTSESVQAAMAWVRRLEKDICNTGSPGHHRLMTTLHIEDAEALRLVCDSLEQAAAQVERLSKQTDVALNVGEMWKDKAVKLAAGQPECERCGGFAILCGRCAAAQRVEIIAQARLEEAEWWAAGYHYHQSPFIAECIQCQRLAEIRALKGTPAQTDIIMGLGACTVDEPVQGEKK